MKRSRHLRFALAGSMLLLMVPAAARGADWSCKERVASGGTVELRNVHGGIDGRSVTPA